MKYKKNLLIEENYSFRIEELPKKIEYKIPLLKIKLHTSISTTNLECKQSIENNYIEMKLLKNKVPISIFEFNQLNYNTITTIEIFTNKRIKHNCYMNLRIIDSYGNMDKTLITIIVPFVLILYFLFKMSWMFIVDRVKTNKSK